MRPRGHHLPHPLGSVHSRSLPSFRRCGCCIICPSLLALVGLGLSARAMATLPLHHGLRLRAAPSLSSKPAPASLSARPSVRVAVRASSSSSSLSSPRPLRHVAANAAVAVRSFSSIAMFMSSFACHGQCD